MPPPERPAPPACSPSAPPGVSCHAAPSAGRLTHGEFTHSPSLIDSRGFFCSPLGLDPTPCHDNRFPPSVLCLFKISVHLHRGASHSSVLLLPSLTANNKGSWTVVCPFLHLAYSPPVSEFRISFSFFIGWLVCRFVYLLIHSTNTTWEITLYQLQF